MAVATALVLSSSLALLGGAAFFALALGFLTVGAARLRAAASTGLVVAIGGICLFTLAMDGPRPAAAVLLRLSALVIFAQVVTETTRASAMQDALVAALRPFERLPFVSAQKAGLALAIALRSLPRIEAAVRELREAREARGLKAGTLKLIVPLVARILRDARETADAIDARSWTGNTGNRRP
jgi:biotin transport system permease protein